jgi:hypothetical protein
MFIYQITFLCILSLVGSFTATIFFGQEIFVGVCFELFVRKFGHLATVPTTQCTVIKGAGTPLGDSLLIL